MTVNILDTQAKQLAKDFLRNEAELLGVLILMKKGNVFPELNCMGVFDYCENILKLSPSQSFYFKSVVEKSIEVPTPKKAIEEGQLSLSQARRIAPILNSANSTEWIDKAQKVSQRQLEKEVRLLNPRAISKERIKVATPNLSESRVPIDKDTEENLKALKDILSQKKGKAATLEEVIAWIAKECREKHDPVKKAERASSSGRKPQIKTGRHPIPQSVKHQVIRQHGFQCSYVGKDNTRYSQTRWISFHHIHEVAHGGLNTPENLKPLCHAHHAMAHQNIKTKRIPNWTRFRPAV